VQAAWEEKGRPRRVFMDLSGVQHIDSSGVGALMEIQQRAVRANVHLTLCKLENGPRRLLERTGISRLFEIRDALGGVVAAPPTSRRKRPHRFLWVFLWLCVIVGGLVATGVSVYPAMKNYHAQLEQVPILNGLVGAIDNRLASVEQGVKDRLGGIETRLDGYIHASRRQQAAMARRAAEMEKRTAELKARLDAVEAAQRGTDVRLSDLEQREGGGPEQ
jgi:ABC-type transporter Mla MlaB component